MGYNEALTFSELYKAAQECARGVRWKDSVQDYLRNPLIRTQRLHNDLVSGKYRISPYIRFHVTEPKRREIVATRFRDRVFQRSLCNNGLYAQFTRGFIYDNGACLNGKGVDFCRNRLKTHLNKFYRKHRLNGWVLKLDIKGFFASIPHAVAKAAVAKRVKDSEMVEAIFDIIDSFANPDPVGIALGSQISQLIALAVLDDLDHLIKERMHIQHYVRYMDDMVLIHEDKDLLRHCWKQIAAWIEDKGMHLKNSSALYPLKQSVVFLKRRYIFKTSGKLLVKMLHSTVTRERRKLRALKGLVSARRLTLDDVHEHLVAWSSGFRRTAARQLLSNIFRQARKLFIEDAQYAQT